MERMVRPGEFYRHFKNRLYQIVTVAEHSETGEYMVVYQALYGDYRNYVRPLEMFLSEVDREKYPDAGQRYRFERVQPGVAADAGADTVAEPEMESAVNPVLLQFLEAATWEEKIRCLDVLERTAGQTELDSIYVVLDMKPQTGDLTQQVEGIRRYLNMQRHYDGGHLR